MTTILDLNNTIKDTESSEVWRNYYFEQFQLKTQIIGVDEIVIKTIARNC